MGWSDKTKCIDDQAVAGVEIFSDWVTLKSDETVHFQVKGDFVAVPTDDLLINVYATLDASAEVSDTSAIIAQRVLSKDTDPGLLSIGGLNGYYKLRLGVVRSGATDTITVDAWYRKNGNYADRTLDI